MSCAKCDPDLKSRRWVWWIALLALMAVLGWVEQTRAEHPAPQTIVQ
jgi:lipopolysaccharide export system protein LptC